MIILIDDCGIQRALIRKLMPGSLALVPDSPNDVLSLMSRDPSSIDFIVVDRHMPKQWVEAAKKIIAHFKLPAERVVEWTATEKEDKRNNQIEVGSHIEKTGTLDELRPLMEKARRNVGMFAKFLAMTHSFVSWADWK